VADVLGEIVWVTVYVSLGVAFSQSITEIADVMGNVLGLLAALAVVIVMIRWIRTAMRERAK
jgi:membrane protein DedA with SNARE-associated domain